MIINIFTLSEKLVEKEKGEKKDDVMVPTLSLPMFH
jgi:hypothetical protein